MTSRLSWTTRLFGTTVIVTGLTLLGSVLNFFAQATLAARFGAASAVDAYSYALSLPILLSGLAGIIISYTAVPLMAKANQDEARARLIGRSLFKCVSYISISIALFGLPAIILQPKLIPPGEHVLAQTDLRYMIAMSWLAGAIQLVTALTAAQLNADNRPIVAAGLGMTVSLGTIASLLLFPHAGIATAMLGLVSGSALGASVGLWFARSHLLPPSLSPSVRREVVALGKSSLWAIPALSCFASYLVIDAIWVSRLGVGALSAMGYAHRLNIGIGSLVVAGPSAMFIPRLAQLVESRDNAGFRRVLFMVVCLIGGAGVIGAIVITFFAQDLVVILFQRGAFNSADTLLVATALRHMAPGFVAMLLSVILLRAVFCLPGAHAISAVFGVAFSLSYFFLSWMMLGKGIEGIANAYSVSWVGFAAGNIFLILRVTSRFEAAKQQKEVAEAA